MYGCYKLGMSEAGSRDVGENEKVSVSEFARVGYVLVLILNSRGERTVKITSQNGPRVETEVAYFLITRWIHH